MVSVTDGIDRFRRPNLKAAVRAVRGEGVGTTRPSQYDFMLRALAARTMRHKQKIPCGRAAGKAAIRASSSMDKLIEEITDLYKGQFKADLNGL